MWKCKHCSNEFNFKNTSEKANHSRWCDYNPNKNNTENLKKAQQLIANKKLGEIKQFIVECNKCKIQFFINEREFQFPKKEKYFCSKSCANSEGGKAKSLITVKKETYRTIAENNHERKCIVCGFDKIVEVHHVNEDHYDNRPSNLVFLCPNHHQMYHSKFKNEILPYINKYITGS